MVDKIIESMSNAQRMYSLFSISVIYAIIHFCWLYGSHHNRKSYCT